MCSYLLCTLPHFPSLFLQIFRVFHFQRKRRPKYMHEQSYFTQFYDTRKKNENRKELLIFTLLLFIFIISFLIIALDEREEAKSSRACAMSKLSLPAVPKLASASGIPCAAASGKDTLGKDQGQHSFAFCLDRKYNDNKLYCGSHVENCFHSREIFSIYITYKAKDH